MLRKTMIALCAMASIGMLAPEMALARGGGGGGHGGGGGGRGGGGMSAGSFAGRSAGGGNFNGGNFGNSFARATPNAGVQGNFQGNFQGNRFAGANSGGRGFALDSSANADQSGAVRLDSSSAVSTKGTRRLA